ncbi:hypothetical protein EVAR_17105_1 [Eumeta japonica]|uniref:Uncharacterized protein n=1 Tax=Eumeta variegata TaxID=151549 RepID=A0A4C1ULV6_EUMVA|nr:hypothetical protein EVAR_17105_1 [Eumeta japonica]
MLLDDTVIEDDLALLRVENDLLKELNSELKEKNNMLHKKNKDTVNQVKCQLLSDIAVLIKKLQTNKSGDITIKCKNKEDVERTTAMLRIKLINNYQVEVQTLKAPRMRILDVQNDMNLENLTEDIKNRNPVMLNALTGLYFGAIEHSVSAGRLIKFIKKPGVRARPPNSLCRFRGWSLLKFSEKRVIPVPRAGDCSETGVFIDRPQETARRGLRRDPFAGPVFFFLASLRGNF